MGLAETLHEHGEVTNEVRDRRARSPAPAPVADRLGLAPGDRVLYIERLRRLTACRSPSTSPTSPLDLGERAARRRPGEHRRLRACSSRSPASRLGRAEITLEAVNADAHSAAVLEVPRGAAVLMLERLTHLADGRPVDLEFIRFRGDRITMRGLLRRSPADDPPATQHRPRQPPPGSPPHGEPPCRRQPCPWSPSAPTCP